VALKLMSHEMLAMWVSVGVELDIQVEPLTSLGSPGCTGEILQKLSQ